MGRRFGAVVIYPNERIKDYGNILAIARRDAKIREKTKHNIQIKDIIFSPICNVYIAIYPSHNSEELHRPVVTNGGRQKMKNEQS